jgi:hypothetical protein
MGQRAQWYLAEAGIMPSVFISKFVRQILRDKAYQVPVDSMSFGLETTDVEPGIEPGTSPFHEGCSNR